MQLIYHSVGSAGSVSPFDAAIQSVAAKAPCLRLASPYIGLGFLLRTIDSAADWRLLSDVEAWLQSGNQRHRARCWEFIADNLDRVRHVPGLHAKVAIGNGRLFLGSANFTEKGVLGRAELSVLITESDQVAEATAWFDELWAVASAPILEEGDALVSALDSVAWTQPRVRARLTATAPQISAVLAETPRPEGFDLAGVMAKAGIEESVKLASIEEAYRQVSEEWFTSGRTFSFAELVARLNQISIAAPREVWRLVIRETVNHWLGGLDPEGYDRYLYRDGRFEPFLPEHHRLISGSSPDQTLIFLLNEMPASPDSKPIPIEDEWVEAGLQTSQILPTIELMLEVGLLVEHDIPGEIERYSIEPSFDWPMRWQKFAEARRLFARTKAEADDRAIGSREEKDTHRYGGERTVIWNQTDTPKPARRSPPTLFAQNSRSGGAAQIKEVAKTAKSQGLPLQDVLVQQDRVLAALIDLLADQDQPIKSVKRKDLGKELSRHRVIESLRLAFTQPELMLSNRNGGMVFNPKWDGAVHLRQFPKALASWRRALTY